MPAASATGFPPHLQLSIAFIAIPSLIERRRRMPCGLTIKTSRGQKSMTGWPLPFCAGLGIFAASIAMAVPTFLMLRTSNPTAAAVLVFIAGLSMAPVFPTTLAMVGNAFPRMTGTATGFVITCGWAGLAVSSRLIGPIAGDDPVRLKRALLLIPGAAVLMVGVNVAIWSALR